MNAGNLQDSVPQPVAVIGSPVGAEAERTEPVPRRRFDPFWLVLGVITGSYLIFWLGLLGAMTGPPANATAAITMIKVRNLVTNTEWVAGDINRTHLALLGSFPAIS